MSRAKQKEAFRYNNLIKDKKLSADASTAKQHYLTHLSISKLRQLYSSKYEDRDVEVVLINKLIVSEDKEDQKAARELAQKHKIKVPSREELLKKPNRKNSYNVAVFLPLFTNDAEAARKNRFAYDMYSGIKLSYEDLTKQGVKLNLYVYDTKQDPKQVKDLLKLPEMKSMDLMLGPVYANVWSEVSAFTAKEQIVSVNPLSNRTEYLTENSYAFLAESVVDSETEQAVTFTQQTFKKTGSIAVLYDGNSKDSSIAYSYKQYAEAAGRDCKMYEIKDITVSGLRKKLSGEKELSHIFAVHSNPSFGANLIGYMQIDTAMRTPVLSYYHNWLKAQQADLNVWKDNNVHFVYEEKVNQYNDVFYNFYINYNNKYYNIPSVYAYKGYDMMKYFGINLNEHGHYFGTELSKKQSDANYTLRGFDYTKGRDNHRVPIYKLDEELNLIQVFPKH